MIRSFNFWVIEVNLILEKKIEKIKTKWKMISFSLQACSVQNVISTYLQGFPSLKSSQNYKYTLLKQLRITMEIWGLKINVYIISTLNQVSKILKQVAFLLNGQKNLIFFNLSFRPLGLIIFQYISMSSIIDSLIDLNYTKGYNSGIIEEQQSLIQELSKSLNNSYGSLIRRNDEQVTKISMKIQHQSKDYAMQITGDRKLRSLSASIQEVQAGFYKKILSKNLETSVINKLIGIHYQHQNQFILCLERSCLVMKLKISYPMPVRRRQTFTRLFNRVLRKNIIQLHNTLVNNFKTRKLAIEQSEKQTQFFSDLKVSLVCNKIDSNFDYSTSRSNPKVNMQALNRHKKELKCIQNAVINEKDLENSSSLYVNIPFEATSAWLSQNLGLIWEAHSRRYKNSLEVANIQDKQNPESGTIAKKIQLKEPMKKHAVEGGSSLIYCGKFLLTFAISSEGSVSNHPDKVEKIEKLLAVKAIKPDYEKHFREKLDHQKRIVQKLQIEGSSFFMPRYYLTEKDSEFNNCLLMDYVNGQEFDTFLKSRSLTISFRTKLFLLFNIMFGIRFFAQNQVVHLDIKPINIMVCRNLITKIIDFGEAYHKDLCPKSYTPGFTFPYVAPQVFSKYETQLMHKRKEQMTFSEKQDVFAFGMIMYQALFDSKMFNFNIQKYREIYSTKILGQRFFFSPERLENFENEIIMYPLMHNIMKCLDSDPQNRPKIDWMGILLKIILNFVSNR